MEKFLCQRTEDLDMTRVLGLERIMTLDDMKCKANFEKVRYDVQLLIA